MKRLFFSIQSLMSVMALTALAACGGEGVADTLGLNIAPPDEFTVVSRPPLSLPPEFNLRPPVPGASPLGTTTNDAAHELLTGQTPAPQNLGNAAPVAPVLSGETSSAATSILLKRAGADSANADIRQQLGTDQVTPADTSQAKSLMEKLSLTEKPEPVVDAKKEAERLRNNKDEGKPATEGEIPVEKTRLPSLVDKIF